MSKPSMTPVFVGIAMDAVDWVGLGLIPIIGDILDLVGIFYFWRQIGPTSLAGLLEFVPFVEIFPTWTTLGIYTYVRGERRD